MLVIDADALKPVDFLNLVHQVARQRHFSLNPQDVLGNRRSAYQGFACLDVIPFVNIDVLAAGNEVFLLVSHVHRRDGHLLFAFFSGFGDAHIAVDLA